MNSRQERSPRAALARAAVVMLVVGGPATAVAVAPQSLSGPIRCATSTSGSCGQPGTAVATARRQAEATKATALVALAALGLNPVAATPAGMQVTAASGDMATTAAPAQAAPAAPTGPISAQDGQPAGANQEGSAPQAAAASREGAASQEGSTSQEGTASGPEGTTQSPSSTDANAEQDRHLSFTFSAFRGPGASGTVNTDGDATAVVGYGYTLIASATEVTTNPTVSSIGLDGQLSAFGFNNFNSLRFSSEGVTLRVTASRDLPGDLAVGAGWDFTLDGDGFSMKAVPDDDRATASLFRAWTKPAGWVSWDAPVTGYVGVAVTVAREDRESIFGQIFGPEGQPVEESELMDRDRAWNESLKLDPAPNVNDPEADDPDADDSDDPGTSDDDGVVSSDGDEDVGGNPGDDTGESDTDASDPSHDSDATDADASNTDATDADASNTDASNTDASNSGRDSDASDSDASDASNPGSDTGDASDGASASDGSDADGSDGGSAGYGGESSDSGDSGGDAGSSTGGDSGDGGDGSSSSSSSSSDGGDGGGSSGGMGGSTGSSGGDGD